ncbi:MAG: hypothetical protein M1839_004655 [Geoglossum umbratile]|nr:MAG: hypothetical protein M1839_004655 [Geoglossum umbratile]
MLALAQFLRALWPVVLLWDLAYSACHFRDGSVDLRSGIQQCDSIFQHNMCCWLNANPRYPDVCTPQGLCLNNSTEPSQLYLDSCADPKWSLGCSPLAEFCSEAMISPCPPKKFSLTTDAESPDVNNFTAITQCDDSSYCCGKNNKTCCEGRHGLMLGAHGQRLSISSATPGTGQPMPTPAPSHTTSPNPAAPAKPGLGPNKVALGIGIGLALPLAVAFAMALWLYWRKKRHAAEFAKAKRSLPELGVEPASSELAGAPVVVEG